MSFYGLDEIHLLKWVSIFVHWKTKRSNLCFHICHSTECIVLQASVAMEHTWMCHSVKNLWTDEAWVSRVSQNLVHCIICIYGQTAHIAVSVCEEFITKMKLCVLCYMHLWSKSTHRCVSLWRIQRKMKLCFHSTQCEALFSHLWNSTQCIILHASVARQLTLMC